MVKASPEDERTPLLRDDADESGRSGKLRKTVSSKSDLERNLIIGAILCGNFLFALDGSLVTSLAPAIGSQFGAAQLAPSLGTFYLAGSCATAPLWGKISDIYGRKPLLVGPACIFTVATLACGMAPSIESLLAFRLIAGIGGSGVLAMGMVVLSDLVAQRKRGLLQGIANAIMSMGFTIGGPVGGVLNDTLGWRAAFNIQLPICVLVTTLYAWKVDIPLPHFDGSLTRWQRLKSIDWYGSLAIICSIFLLIGGLQVGGNLFEWNEWPPLTMIILGLCGFLVFGLIEKYVAVQPIVALDVLFTRTVAFASLANLAQALTIFTIVFQLPFLFLAALGLTPSDAGFHYLPSSLGLGVGSIIGGQLINRTGRYQPIITLANLLVAITPALIAATWIPNLYVWEKNDWRYYFEVSLSGLGNGLALPGILLAVISSVDHARMATVTSINSFTRILGQVLGVSLSSAFVNERVRLTLLAAFAGKPNARELADKIRNNVLEITHLPPELRKTATDAYRDALQLLFWITFGIALLGGLFSAFVPQHELSNKAPAASKDADDDDE